MNQHVILPSLNAYFGFEQINFLKTIKFDQWNLILCVLDYYAKGNDSLYEAYWQSYLLALNEEMDDVENFIEARQLYNNITTIRETTDGIYSYLKNSICMMLHQHGFASHIFNNVAGVSPGDNYFRVELLNGIVQ